MSWYTDLSASEKQEVRTIDKSILDNSIIIDFEGPIIGPPELAGVYYDNSFNTHFFSPVYESCLDRYKNSQVDTFEHFCIWIDFMIKDLENCTVMLLDHTAQVTIDRCKNTKFYVGPVKASIFFRDCSDCEITVSCSQFRCRDLMNSKLFLFTPNDPIVESSSGLTISPYNFRYPYLESQAKSADLVGEFTDDDGVV